MANEKEYIINEDGEVVKNNDFDPDISDEDEEPDDQILEFKD